MTRKKIDFTSLGAIPRRIYYSCCPSLKRKRSTRAPIKTIVNPMASRMTEDSVRLQNISIHSSDHMVVVDHELAASRIIPSKVHTP